jgi:hypothetical protein
MNVCRSSGSNGLQVAILSLDEQRPGRPWIWDSEATKELLKNSHQQVHSDYQTHLALQRVLFIAT